MPQNKSQPAWAARAASLAEGPAALSVQVCPGPGCSADAHSPDSVFCRIPQQGLFVPVLNKQGLFLTADIPLDYSSACFHGFLCFHGPARAVWLVWYGVGGGRRLLTGRGCPCRGLFLKSERFVELKCFFFFFTRHCFEFFLTIDNVELNWRVVHIWIYMMMRS